MIAGPDKPHPRAFVSYAWTSPAHEQWVIDLATQVMEAGVEVKLDKWDLREGQDAYKFMEEMVTDPTITKVIVVSDKKYAEKSAQRKGGVGTESQIMSAEIYKKADQTKFVAVVSELDENNEPYLPPFFTTRIYIDLTPSQYATNFEQLIRWLYDKPLYLKPALGKRPAFLDNEPVSTPMSVASRQVKRLLATQVSEHSAIQQYLTTLATTIAGHRIDSATPNFAQAVLEDIDALLPLRNEYLEVISGALPRCDAQLLKIIQRFFEQMIPLTEWPEGANTFRESDTDNFRFIAHELFLYTVAIFLRHERYSELNDFLNLRFYAPNRFNPKIAMRDYTVLDAPTRSFERKQRELRRISLRADLLEQRSHVSGMRFADVMAADFVLFLRNAAVNPDGRWYPYTLLYTTMSTFHPPFEIFARAESRSYFREIAPVIGWNSAQQLVNLVSEFSDQTHGRWLPRWEYETLNLASLMNLPNLESKP